MRKFSTLFLLIASFWVVSLTCCNNDDSSSNPGNKPNPDGNENNILVGTRWSDTQIGNNNDVHKYTWYFSSPTACTWSVLSSIDGYYVLANCTYVLSGNIIKITPVYADFIELEPEIITGTILGNQMYLSGSDWDWRFTKE